MTGVISINLKLHCPGGLWSSSWHIVLTDAYHSMVSFSNVMSITTGTCFTIGLKEQHIGKSYKSYAYTLQIVFMSGTVHKK